ncbi:hypothetical protein Mapa_007991 [Marchantia paleacea]|nr:hypothetical protein Mapa_007991 [Marchantia paleacea]
MTSISRARKRPSVYKTIYIKLQSLLGSTFCIVHSIHELFKIYKPLPHEYGHTPDQSKLANSLCEIDLFTSDCKPLHHLYLSMILRASSIALYVLLGLPEPLSRVPPEELGQSC